MLDVLVALNLDGGQNLVEILGTVGGGDLGCNQTLLGLAKSGVLANYGLGSRGEVASGHPCGYYLAS